MFADELRRAVEASPRMSLPKLSAVLWKAYAAGSVSEAQASELSDLIEARKALPTPKRPIRRRVGSRPRPPRECRRLILSCQPAGLPQVLLFRIARFATWICDDHGGLDRPRHHVPSFRRPHSVGLGLDPAEKSALMVSSQHAASG